MILLFLVQFFPISFLEFCYIFINDNIKITRLSAGNKHTYRFTIANGIEAKDSGNANINLNFLLFDQCASECKDTSEVSSYMWNVYDDWSAQGIINVPTEGVETDKITILQTPLFMESQINLLPYSLLMKKIILLVTAYRHR